MQGDDSLLNKKIDSHTTNPSGNNKRRNIPQELIDETNRQRQLKANQISRWSDLNFSDINVKSTEEQKLEYIQNKLNAITFTTRVNQGHGLPFPEQKQQQAPFGLLCRGLTS